MTVETVIEYIKIIETAATSTYADLSLEYHEMEERAKSAIVLVGEEQEQAAGEALNKLQRQGYDTFLAQQKKKKLKKILEVSSGDVHKGAKVKVGDLYKFYYRGHYKSSYHLMPSVLRDGGEKEDYYYHEIMVRCPEGFEFLKHLDKLVLMQHYDCPTRLLDITSNPLVALYFACKKFRMQGMQPSQRWTSIYFQRIPG